MVMRSAPEMASFLIYCEQHPELRFWQAMVEWTGVAYDDGEKYWGVVLTCDHPACLSGGEDTYYWEWEGEHPIGPGRHANE